VFEGYAIITNENDEDLM